MRCVFPPSASRHRPVHFLVGCGRSGTTILGLILAKNESIHYIYEPYHLWYIVDPRLDATGLHARPSDVRFFLDEDDYSDDSRGRFDSLFSRRPREGIARCVIEKTPHNAARIGWIDAIEPGARFIHIVRNGINVVRSIDRIATESSYRYAFRSGYNQWWGEGDVKWNALKGQGAARGYFPDEVDLLTSHTQRGAYEWLVSIGEIDHCRDRLDDRIFEITYTQLTSEPATICKQIADHIDVPAPRGWLDQACGMLSKERVNEGDDLLLPPAMASKFNEYQERYGFDGRAVSI